MRAFFDQTARHTVREIVDHDPVDPGLLVQTPDHDFLVDGLIVSSYEIIIEIHVEIIHVLHIGHGVEDIDIIHVEAVLRKIHAAFAKERGPVDHGMHEDVLPFFEPLCLIPGENTAFGKRFSVLHHFAVGGAFLVIDEVADQKIELLVSLFGTELSESIQDRLIGACLDLVVAVDHFKEHSGRVLKARVDSAAVPFVGLVDRPYDAGIFLLQRIGDLRRIIFRSVVDHQDLHFVSPDEQGTDAVFHIILRVVTRDCYR